MTKCWGVCLAAKEDLGCLKSSAKTQKVAQELKAPLPTISPTPKRMSWEETTLPKGSNSDEEFECLSIQNIYLKVTI
jgi:hypothetical protein